MGTDLDVLLRYFHLDGTIAALRRLGWEYRKGEGDIHSFTKKIGDVVEHLILHTFGKAFTRIQVRNTLDQSPGIRYKDFESGYIRFYDGKPPPMPF